MPRYWVIAPFESKPPGAFDKVWQFDVANSLISIGWSQLGDISKLGREELSNAVASAYPDKPPSTKSLYVNMLWAFYHEVSPGDLVVARRGRKTLAAVGKVIGPAAYAPGKNPAAPHRNFFGVAWQEQPRDRTFATLVFQMRTLVEISEDQYRGLLGPTPPDLAQEGEETADKDAFVLEKYLEEFIVSNFKSIFKGKLQIYEDSEGADGQQYATDVGPIDILAIEPESNSFIVMELKKGRPSDQVIGQILRYMGWVKKNLCKEDQGVKGLVICHDPDPKLSYALEMTDSIDVRYYKVSFSLNETP
ncbi:MAG: endonuclease NucS domain-containing protein [Bryobacteraceae bacterium]